MVPAYVLLPHPVDVQEALTLFGAIVGSVVGILQWLLLRRRVRYAAWWLAPYVLAGMAVGFIHPIVGVVLYVFGTAVILERLVAHGDLVHKH